MCHKSTDDLKDLKLFGGAEQGLGTTGMMIDGKLCEVIGLRPI